MPTTIDKRPEDRFFAAFEIHEGHTLNGSNAVLEGLRKEAIGHFSTLGFPAPKTEAWKYTNITKVLAHDFALQLKPTATAESDLTPFLIPGLDAYVAVFINGHFDAARSALGGLPEGVIVMSLAQAKEVHADLFNHHFAQYADHRKEVFTALNTAFTHDGLFVYVPRNTVVEKPIFALHLIEAEADTFLLPRHLIIAERSAQVQIIEHCQGQTEAKTFSNTVTECFVGANAHVDHYKIQDDGPNASQVNTLHAYQEGNSYFSTLTATISGAVVRNNLHFLPNAENCETHLLGLTLANGKTHVDNHTLVDHAQPNCFSNELYKGILDENATGVFNGKVLVRQDAQKTNAYQSNKSVVLTETARMFSKPELEIYADDVKCSHGATTGQLDAEAMFYLRTRGLTKEKARMLLLHAFARDVLDEIKNEPLRAYLDAKVEALLH